MATPPRPRRDVLEVLATFLLAAAAVATAWSSYQATRWNGEQAKTASATNAIRIEAVRKASLGQTATEVDVALFVQWVDANEHGETALAAFYADRFRDEFKPAFNAWLATQPSANPNAPRSPFATPEYRVKSQLEAEELDVQAEAGSAMVRNNIQRAGNYVLGVVLFAVALFFGGMSTKLQGRPLRITMLSVGYLMFLGTAVWIATFPVSLSV